MVIDIRTSLAWIGAGVSLLGTLRYAKGIIQEGTRPRLASWFGWGAANAVLTFLAYIDHDYQMVYFNGLAAAGNLTVLLISALKRAGERPSGLSDWVCLCTGLLCAGGLLCFPHDENISTVLALLASIVATLPTIVHAWRQPHAETWQLFAANMAAGSLGIVSIPALDLISVAGPLVMTVANATLTTITILRRPRVQRELAGIAHEFEELFDTNDLDSEGV